MQRNEKALWSEYFKKALERPHSPLTERAVELNRSGLLTATDCGCGTGSDIHFLIEHNYQVNAFDQQEEAIGICRERFSAAPEMSLEVSTFEGYCYPLAGIVIAHNSLYFADRGVFNTTWDNIKSSIAKGGVFAGSFIGYEDDWVVATPERMCPVDEADLSEMFADFDVLMQKESKYVGDTVLKKQKHWHVYHVLAIRL